MRGIGRKRKEHMRRAGRRGKKTIQNREEKQDW
jgi:hypothetical protein